MSPTTHRTSSLNRLAARRALLCMATALSTAAHAQNMGQGLIGYVTPIILFLGVGAVVVALVSAIFKPDLVKTAIWAAVILVIVFFILRNTASFQAAVQ